MAAPFPQDNQNQPPTNGAVPDQGTPGSISALLFGPPPETTDPVAKRLQQLDPVDLSIKLDDEASRRLAHRICSMIDQYRQVNRRRLDALNFWRLAYEMMPPGTSTRWENSADIPSPLTRIATNAHHTKLNQQLGGTVPPFAAVAKTPAALEAAPLIEECMASVLDQASWTQVMDDLHRELAVAGNVFVRTTYERKYQRMPKHKVDLDDDTIDSAVRAGLDLHDAVGHGIQRVRFGHEEKLVYDGVRFKVVKWEDGIILPAMKRDPEEADGIGERLRVTGFDLLQGVRDGIYFADAVEDLLNKPADPRPLDRLQREEEIGRTDVGYGSGSPSDPDDALYNEHEIYELCWKMLPPDEMPEDHRFGWVSATDTPAPVWTVLHLHYESRTIIGHQYLQYAHGRPYYMLERYMLRTNELWAMSVPELIAAIQDGDTAVRNQIIDLQDYMAGIRGNFFYTRMSGWDPDKTISQPGRPVQVEELSPEAIREMPVPTIPADMYQVRNSFKDEVDLLTATSNPMLGKGSEGNKTLGEVQIVTNAAQQIFEDTAGRVARQHALLWDQGRWLTAQYGLNTDTGQIEYRRTAMPDQEQFARIDPKMLSAEVDLVPTGLQQLSDMASRMQQATLAMTQFQNLPFVHANPMAFMPSILQMWTVYLQSMKYPDRQRHEAILAQDVQRMMGQQMHQMQLAGVAAQAGLGQPIPGAPGGEGGPGGAGPAPPPGDVGGPPAPLPAPPPLPEGSTAQTALPQGLPLGAPG